MHRSPLTLADLWATAHFTPNPAQRDAILHVNGPLYLPAGPGYGKTNVLLWRTLNLIVFHHVPPEEIFLATFTEKAAHQLREGLRARLAIATAATGVAYDIGRMYIGTIHALCQRVLKDRRFYPRRQLGSVPSLLDELAQYFTLYKQSTWQELTQAAGFPDSPNRAINRLSEECVEIEAIRARATDPTPTRATTCCTRNARASTCCSANTALCPRARRR